MYIIHYGELALKSKNRKFFEKKLQENIQKKLNKLNNITVKKKYGKLVIFSDNPEIEEILAKTPGISYFAKGFCAKLEMEDIIQKTFEIFPTQTQTFKVETHRTNKKFPLKSPEISKLLGYEIIKKFGTKVNVQKPETTIFVNIAEQESYIYFEKKQGIGGLPVGSIGHVISLISGGIDSPVSSFLLMKRGCKVTFVHAHNKSSNSSEIKEKILQLQQKLSQFQGKSEIFFVPYDIIQKDIVQGSPEKFRMLLFKRSIVRIANEIAKKVGAKAVVLGDSLGQVASQTLENINCIYSVSQKPIFSPLLGYDKQEIINLAQKIGTYEISIIPHPDCCSLISTNGPETKGNNTVLEKLENKIMIKIAEDKTIANLFSEPQNETSSEQN